MLTIHSFKNFTILIRAEDFASLSNLDRVSSFYGGGNGPQALRMCGRIMDGLISSGTYIPMLKAGRLPGVVTNDDYKKCGFRRILVFSAAAHGSGASTIRFQISSGAKRSPVCARADVS